MKWFKVVSCDVNGFPLGLGLKAYDYVSNVSTPTTDTFTFKTGGAGGTVIATIALVFTDATKGTLSTVTKT